MKITFRILGFLLFLIFFGCARQPRVTNTEKMPSMDKNIDKEKEKTVVKSKNILLGKVICIDPGHAINSLSKKELVSPISTITKDAYISGTFGKNLTEEKLNLAVALKLRKLLENDGAKVIMTREVSEVVISNIQRAEMANNENADVNIHIHADASRDLSIHGVSVLVPFGKLLGTPTIIEPSAKLGKSILDSVVAGTGAENRGIVKRSDLTGFNWSKIPTVMVEMGFMSNFEEEKLMASDLYQNKIAEGLHNGLINYFN